VTSDIQEPAVSRSVKARRYSLEAMFVAGGKVIAQCRSVSASLLFVALLEHSPSLVAMPSSDM
jgi:hypothetical protein